LFTEQRKGSSDKSSEKKLGGVGRKVGRKVDRRVAEDPKRMLALILRNPHIRKET
jgi:hypothetical protein